MKIAVTTEEGNVFQHFGHCRYFTIAEIENGVVKSKRIADAEGSGHSALGEFLKTQGVEVLICGGIGGGARQVLAEAGIQLMPGVPGTVSVEEAVQAFAEGTLECDPDASCAGHGHDHGAGHSCGEHDHNCGGH